MRLWKLIAETMYNVITMFKTRKAFTLIEFMVAMSLVAILSGIAMGNFMGTQKRGRDVRRQSDLNQYRVALENYASTNSGTYPTTSGITNLNTALANYMTGFPTDPQGNSYTFFVDPTGTVWVLGACGEVNKVGYQVCSTGKAGYTTLACNDANLNDSTCDLP